MHPFAVLLLTTAAAQLLPPPRPLDIGPNGDWTLVRLERDGQEVRVGQPRLAVRERRLHLGGDTGLADTVLELCPDNRIRLANPKPPQAPTVYYPYTPKEWAKRFGDPTYYPGPEQYVIDRVSGLAVLVPPMPCVVIQPADAGPQELGVFVLSGDKLALQFVPAGDGPSLLLVLERAPAAKKAGR